MLLRSVWRFLIQKIRNKTRIFDKKRPLTGHDSCITALSKIDFRAKSNPPQPKNQLTLKKACWENLNCFKFLTSCCSTSFIASWWSTCTSFSFWSRIRISAICQATGAFLSINLEFAILSLYVDWFFKRRTVTND